MLTILYREPYYSRLVITSTRGKKNNSALASFFSQVFAFVALDL